MIENPAEFPALSSESGISPVEREEIRAQIEKVATENRIPVEAAQFSLREARRGIALPVIVNAAVLAAAVLAVLGLGLASRQGDQRLRSQETTYASVEGRLIRELRQESQQLMSLKQREIEEVRGKLQELERRQSELAATFDARLKAKEEEFRLQLKREIEAERARLATQGVGKADIDSRIVKFEADRKAYYDQQLEKYRKQLEAEKAQVQADIDKLRAEYTERLKRLEKEQQEIVAEYAKRDAALRAQLEQRTLVMERMGSQSLAALAAAQRELARLTKVEEQAGVVENQIDGLVAKLRETAASGDDSAALARVRELQAYLNRDEVRSSSRLAGRIRAESFLLNELGSLLERRIRIGSAESGASLAQDLELLALSRKLSREAAASKNDAARLELYRQALAAFPDLKTASDAVVAAEVKIAVEKALADQSAGLLASAAPDAIPVPDESASPEARIASLTERLARSEALYRADEKLLDDAIARAKTDRLALGKRIDALSAFEAQVAAAKAAYSTYLGRDEAAKKDNPADPASASRLELNRFLRGDDVKRLFSDISDRVSALYAASQTAGSSAALAEAASIVGDAAKQPTVKAERLFLQSEIGKLKDGDQLKAILRAVDDALAKAPAAQ